MEYYGSTVWINSVKTVNRNEHSFDFTTQTSRFRCITSKGKWKNRSTDVSNISSNSSVGNTTALNIGKTARVNSTSNKQSTLLLGFVDQQRRPPQGQGTIKTVTADSDENHRVDSCSLKDQL